MTATSFSMDFLCCIINTLNKILVKARNNQNITRQFLSFTQKTLESLDLSSNDFLGLDIKNSWCLSYKV